MFTFLFIGIAFMISYMTNGGFFSLFIAVLSFLLATICYGALRNRVGELEKKVDRLEEFFKQQVDISKKSFDIIKKAAVYEDREGDDLK